MVLKLYGFPMSTYTRLVALTCKEKDIPYELVPVNFAKGEHKAADFVKIQPFGQVPYIVDDDGFTLYESRAIARYLISKYPNQGTTGLIPTDPKEAALFEQAASVEVSHWNAHVAPLVFEKVVKQLFLGAQADEDKAKEYLEKLEAKLDVYDIILGKQRYLAGDNVTLADLQHLPYGTALITIYSHVIESRPNVARWWKDIFNRPAWQAVKDGA